VVTWKWRTFQELTTQELYNILALRQEVFVVEQKCFYQDIDNQDQQAVHLLGMKNHNLAAYLRLFPIGTLYTDALSFGRVVVKQSERSQGLASEAMNQVELFLKKSKNTAPVIISAQMYLKEFYASYGYQTTGTPYDEDGIPHIKMIHQ
jgi:ElaA protein